MLKVKFLKTVSYDGKMYLRNSIAEVDESMFKALGVKLCEPIEESASDETVKEIRRQARNTSLTQAPETTEIASSEPKPKVRRRRRKKAE